LITSAFTFVVRGDILQDLGNYFRLSQEQKGGIEGAVFLGMAFSMLGGGFICDLLGMKRIMWLAFASHVLGSLGTIYAPQFEDVNYTYYWLLSLSFLMGCGNGFTEVAINPLIATLYPTRKTHYLNVLHAWWPGGLVIGGLASQFLVRQFFPSGLGGMELWQTSLWLITIPALIYGAMLLSAQFPVTERVGSGVSTPQMFMECLRPMFILWAVCMLMTAATELGPQKWQESVIQSTAGFSGTLILVYTSGMMFVLRHFAGPIAHRISPVGLLFVSSIFAGVGLYLLSFATDAITAFTYATIFGLGIAYFWPTMLGVTAERFPKGGALALALMGSVGNLSISQVLPTMGRIVDHYGVEQLDNSDDAIRSYLTEAPVGSTTDGEATDASVERAVELDPVLDRLSSLDISTDDLRAAYQDPALAAGFSHEALQEANSIFLELVQADGDEQLATSEFAAHADLALLASRQALMDAYADEDWVSQIDFDHLPDSYGEGPGAEERSKLVEAAQLKGSALTFTQVERTVVDGVLDVTAMDALRAQVVEAAQALQGSDPHLAQDLITKPEVYEKLKASVETPDDTQAYENLAGQLTARGTIDLVMLVEQSKVTPAANLIRLRLSKLKIVTDAQSVGFSWAFRWVSILPVGLIILFGIVILYDRSRGGYKPELLISKEEENELLSGGVEGPVE
jgi:MFS family permease